MPDQTGTEPLDGVGTTTLEVLVARARALIADGSRRILGVTGTPGSGKSTVSALLVEALGPDAVLVGMDGFHLANRELIRLGRRERKGAPDTFDVDGYVALLGRLARQRPAGPDSGGPDSASRDSAGRGGGDIYSPVFDRGLEESIGSAVPVPSSVPLIVTEGNYLLGEQHGWAAVRPLLDEAWFVEVDPEERRERLIRRRLSFGHPLEAAEAWVRDVDEQNAVVIDSTRDRADLVVRLAPGI